MADRQTTIIVSPATDQSKTQLSIQNGQLVGADGKNITSLLLDPRGGTWTVQPVDAPTVALDTPFSWLVFAALIVPLLLSTVLGGWLVYGMVWQGNNLAKTLDKLAQLLSEEGSQKMSFSRVQAMIFTYVIAFGSLLIIARTGQFPTDIPEDLAILAGGSLGTYVVSKAIQRNTDSSTNNPSPSGGNKE